jgi:hypothetical protein
MLTLPEFANPVLSEQETRNLFGPYAARLIAVKDKIWAQWLGCPQRTMLDARTRASFLSALFWHEVKGSFEGDPNIHVTHNGGSIFLYIGTEAKTRLKKLKTDGTYSNIMTRTQLNLIKQMNMPFMPGTYLTIGYQLDPLEQRIASLRITLQSTKGVVYAIDLDEMAASSSSAPAVTPMPQVPPQTNAPRARARKDALKRIKKEKTSGQEQ